MVMHKRLFIALPIPEATQQALMALKPKLLFKDAKWVKAQNLHLTLRFLGHQEETLLPEVHEALNAIKAQAFALIPTGLGTFNQHHVLWFGVEPSEMLMQLKYAIDTALVPLGFIPEEQAFQPHITLARLKAASRRQLKNVLEHHAAEMLPAFPVTEFVLYESRSTESGVEYVPLYYYSL